MLRKVLLFLRNLSIFISLFLTTKISLNFLFPLTYLRKMNYVDTYDLNTCFTPSWHTPYIFPGMNWLFTILLYVFLSCCLKFFVWFSWDMKYLEIEFVRTSTGWGMGFVLYGVLLIKIFFLRRKKILFTLWGWISGGMQIKLTRD